MELSIQAIKDRKGCRGKRKWITGSTTNQDSERRTEAGCYRLL